MNRCLNDPFGYCSGGQNPETTEETQTIYDLGGKAYHQTITITRCTNNPRHCASYITNTELTR